VFKEYYVDLIQSLPMQDVLFLANLFKHSLIFGSLKNEVKQKSTSEAAADYFLDNAIEKDIARGRIESFVTLLSIMEEYSPSLRNLATEIKKKLSATVNTPEPKAG